LQRKGKETIIAKQIYRWAHYKGIQFHKFLNSTTN